MEQINLGKSDIRVSRMGFGCWGLSGAYGSIAAGEAERLLQAVADTGINFLDTADVYGGGANEELLGRALAGRRQEVVLATKFGYVGDEMGGLRIDGRPEYVVAACEASLRRLRTDYLDLYYLHRVDKTVPIAETVGAMQRLKDQGKIRAIGLSEAGIATLQKAGTAGRIDVLQSEYSLATPDLQDRVLPFLEEQGITLAAFSPLGRGMLTALASGLQPGSDDYRRLIPRFQEPYLSHNIRIAEQMQDMAQQLGTSLAILSLGWILASGNHIPIPGTRKLDHLRENCRALELRLSPDIVQQLASLARQFRGARHNPANAAFYDVD
ncbi:MAG: aldo/keto reductase [Saprospiraceae bacterium]|nr:aldo/keto reductase [Saprospiraceae bacterium]